MLVTVFRARCSCLLRKDRKIGNKERSCRMHRPFRTAVTVSHGRDCFRRRWLFCTDIWHAAMTVLHAKGRSVHFCMGRYNAKIILSAKGWIVCFCTRRSKAKIILSVKGRSVRFCMRQSNIKLLLSVRRRSVRFACGNIVPSLYCLWKDGESVFARPDLSFCYG